MIKLVKWCEKGILWTALTLLTYLSSLPHSSVSFPARVLLHCEITVRARDQVKERSTERMSVWKKKRKQKKTYTYNVTPLRWKSPSFVVECCTENRVTRRKWFNVNRNKNPTITSYIDCTKVNFTFF